MKVWADFLDEVMPAVPGCEVPIAENAIRNTVIEFCEKTLILQRDCDPITAVAGQFTYDLPAPPGYLICKVMQAWYLGNPLVATTYDYVDNPASINDGFAGVTSKTGTPVGYTQKDERTLTLLPAPQSTSEKAVTIRAALKPTRSSKGVDDVLFEDYAEYIGFGAKARLMALPSLPFSNPQLAAAMSAMYTTGINLARQRAGHGYVRANLQVKMRRV